MLLNLTFNFRIWTTFRTKSFKERRQEELRKQKMAEEAEEAGVPDDETATEDESEDDQRTRRINRGRRGRAARIARHCVKSECDFRS